MTEPGPAKRTTINRRGFLGAAGAPCSPSPARLRQVRRRRNLGGRNGQRRSPQPRTSALQVLVKPGDAYQQWMKGFEDAFPGVTVEIQRMPSAHVKIIEETKAGIFNLDILFAATTSMVALRGAHSSSGCPSRTARSSRVQMLRSSEAAPSAWLNRSCRRSISTPRLNWAMRPLIMSRRFPGRRAPPPEIAPGPPSYVPSAPSFHHGNEKPLHLLDFSYGRLVGPEVEAPRFRILARIDWSHIRTAAVVVDSFGIGLLASL